MPRICEPCRYHTADDAVKACPKCKKPVKFTLLPILGEESKPLAGLPVLPEDVRPVPVRVSHLFRGQTGIIIAATMVALSLGVIAIGMVRETFEDRVAKIKPGMAVIEAMRAMGDNNVHKKKLKIKVLVGGTPSDTCGEDFDDPIDITGDGYLVYEHVMDAVHITYQDGIVTKVERKDAVGGMRVRSGNRSR